MSKSNPDNGKNVLVSFEDVLHDTGAAKLIALCDGNGVWIPDSLIVSIDEDSKDLWIPLWLAEEKGIDYE